MPNFANASLRKKYHEAKKQSTQFKCGWNCNYLQKMPRDTNINKFGGQHFSATILAHQSSQPVSQPSGPRNVDASNQPSFFMASRPGCGFARAAATENQKQKYDVQVLNCVDPVEGQHQVCKLNRQMNRGSTPNYFQKVDGPEQYKLVHRGYTKDLSFMD